MDANPTHKLENEGEGTVPYITETVDTSTYLNLNQTPEELASLYGETDYYWYLRSPQFREIFIQQIASIINALSISLQLVIPYDRVLDVGCGEGCLADYVTVPYTGLDGSVTAIERARLRKPDGDFRVGRFESPQIVIPYAQYGVIVFGGVLEVLIRLQHRVDFIEMYLKKYDAKFFIIYDLLRLDTSPIDARFIQLSYYAATALGVASKGVPLEPVKLARKVILYQAQVNL